MIRYDRSVYVNSVVDTSAILSFPVKSQSFPFLASFISYILQNTNSSSLLKLYQCCKYFYCKSEITIAPNVWYINSVKRNVIEFNYYSKNGYNLFPRWNPPKFKKPWLTDKLDISGENGPECPLIGYEFLNKISLNNLRKLIISSGFTLFKELVILSNSPNLFEVDLITKIQNEMGNQTPIEEIMILFPYLKEFVIRECIFTMESFNKLLNFKFLNKFKKLQFLMVETEFDPISLCKFLKENFDDNADFALILYPSQFETELMPRVHEIIHRWDSKKPKLFHY